MNHQTGDAFRSVNGNKLIAGPDSKPVERFVRASGLRNHVAFLRHAWASLLNQSGDRVFRVQRLLGHSGVDVTLMCAHLLTGEMQEAAKRIVIDVI